VPKDFVGTQFVCPLCQWVISLDSTGRDGSIQASAAAASKGNEPKNLEEQIYDGLPPLAIMMALKRRKGPAYDADDRKFEMTEDDWKALAAFEAMLRAAGSVRTAVMVSGFALAVNLPMLGVSSYGFERHPEVLGYFVRVAVGAVIALLVCLLVLLVGSRAVEKARPRGLVDFVPGTAGCAALICVAAAAFSYFNVLESFFAVANLAANGTAIALLVQAARRVSGALQQIEPPEITNRIQEALKYLE
jgi:hypothetical protein